MPYGTILDGTRWSFPDLKTLLAKASPARSGDELAGIAAESAIERVAAQLALADLPLKTCLDEVVIPYEADEVTRLIVDSHDAAAFAPIAHLTIGEFREFLLDPATSAVDLSGLAPGLTPEMAAAVSKLCRVQDLIAVAAKTHVTTRFRNTIGLPSRLSTRLQPNHPTDESRGIAASLLDGILHGAGDAVVGVNPATDRLEDYIRIVTLLDDIRLKLDAPTQSCCLGHVTTAIEAINRGAPVDLVFQSIAGSEKANRGFGVDLKLLDEACQAGLSLQRGSIGDNVMYFETGQGSALSADAHFGVDQQTMEARAYAVARHYRPLIVNTVVGFIGPEYLFNGKEIIRAGLEDHFCGKLLGLPMGCDVCYTNHAEADQDDMDVLLTVLSAAGVTFVIVVPGADDVMLNYQSLAYHDVAYVRRTLNRPAAPEFEAWLQRVGLARTGLDPALSAAVRDTAAVAPALRYLEGLLA
ncbi:MAG: ethanolamine ammonia-lyase subunit EutB [Ancalomicrobiaceae bacterium]|nr:ethanolamine ammonia-lyase subunit EutB [Ancalomicrobiaceae bacterium]